MSLELTEHPQMDKVGQDQFGRDLYKMRDFGSIHMAAGALEAIVRRTGSPAALLWYEVPATLFPGMTLAEWYHVHSDAWARVRADKAGT